MDSTYKYLLIENRGKLRIITINNPQKKNALNKQGYQELTWALNDAAEDEDVSIVALTGAGDFYSSGNDIAAAVSQEQTRENRLSSKDILRNLVAAFIDFPKVLVGVINGPCIGITATTAALCDVIYCSENAYFYTPFTKLGLCPEGCSSYTFPKIFGVSKATELLLLDAKLTAKEALEYKFVSEIFKLSELETKIWPKLEKFSKLPPNAMSVGKGLVRQVDKDELHKVLYIECEQLQKQYTTEEAITAMMSFMTRKSKM